ncbi:MAG: AAA family ATPase [Saccharofermentans sp.]|nr:AAA family ATPase [Saccharofermentans sp.]
MGADYEVTGVEGEYKGKPQIIASLIEQVDVSKVRQTLIASFLEENFDGIGPKTSVRLAESYGEAVLDTLLENPQDCAIEAPGLSATRAIEISGIIDECPEKYKTLMQLRMYDLSKAQCETCWNEYGTGCIELIQKNPYSIMRIKGIGFESCDRIADIIDFDLLDPNRFEGAIVNVLYELHQATGDTYLDPCDVRMRTLSAIGKRLQNGTNLEVLDSIMDSAEELAVEHKHIVIYRFINGKCSACKSSDEGARVSLASYFYAELTIKREIESFLKAKKIVPNKEKALKVIDSIASESGITLDENQRNAIHMSMYEPISIITGGPGTGKTTITGILAEYFRRENIDCAYCAPTGRAAKRLSDAAGVKATTIHRLLEINGESQLIEGSDFMFGRGPENPIDARVIIVDETSMVDAQLFMSLLLAIRKNSSLILIGDPDQLPSVGPGNILSDLLTCEAVPRVGLTYVFRQDNESSIAANSKRILEGQMPIGNDEDFQIITANDEEEALNIIKNYCQQIGENADSVILSPTKQNKLGTVNMNTELQTLFTAGVENKIKVRNDMELFIHDKVMQVKNNYKIEYFNPDENELQSGIFNGEIGTISDIDFMTGGCTINFDGGRCVNYDKKSLADIELAYAMTVHKAQGCEFDTVFITLGKMNYKLSNRKLLYTAVTRGKHRVVIIDACNRLASMVASDDDISRHTSLSDFLSIVSRRYI